MDSNSKIVSTFMARTPSSEVLFERARRALPSGVVHDTRYVRPWPVYVERAEAGRKWDADGNEYVDYMGGHGALLLGHCHPAMIGAVKRQLGAGTHFGSCHELEIEWAEAIQRLMPAAERVRFTGSGTESTLLAMRLARAYTGRPKIVRFLGHFHGWQDHVAFGVTTHHDGTAATGVLDEVAENVVLCPPGDIEAVRQVIGQRQDGESDIAAVMLEPTGATWGQVPLPEGFLADLREVTAAHGVVLIFDEVISGFRCCPGGAQSFYGVTPDISTLAKIVAGGFPGGAVVGRKEIMGLIDFEESAAAGREKVVHTGTFNANPVSACAGIATLGIIAEGEACEAANDYAARLREGLARAVKDAGINWVVYGSFSGFHIFTNPDDEPLTAEDINTGEVHYGRLKGGQRKELITKLRLAMLVHGVDMFGWPGGPTSAVHTSEDLEQTVAAFRQSIAMLKAEGEV